MRELRANTLKRQREPRSRAAKASGASTNPLVYDIHLERGAAGQLIVRTPKNPAVSGQLIRWHLSGFECAGIGPFLDGSVQMIRSEATETAVACGLAVQATAEEGVHYSISVDAGTETIRVLRASVLYTLIITDTFPGPLLTGRVTE